MLHKPLQWVLSGSLCLDTSKSLPLFYSKLLCLTVKCGEKEFFIFHSFCYLSGWCVSTSETDPVKCLKTAFFKCHTNSYFIASCLWRCVGSAQSLKYCHKEVSAAIENISGLGCSVNLCNIQDFCIITRSRKRSKIVLERAKQFQSNGWEIFCNCHNWWSMGIKEVIEKKLPLTAVVNFHKYIIFRHVHIKRLLWRIKCHKGG